MPISSEALHPPIPLRSRNHSPKLRVLTMTKIAINPLSIAAPNLFLKAQIVLEIG